MIDNNEEWVEVDLTTQGKPMAPKNDKVALIDADTVIYASCSACSYTEELLPEYMYTPDEWKELTSQEGYDPDTKCVTYLNMDEAKVHADDKIRLIMDETGCIDYELHFTVGRNSFRYNVVDLTYKANRLGTKPPIGLYDLKKIFDNEGKSTIHTNIEADDAVVMLKKEYPDKYILCAVDKDVLYSLEGRHFNYYSSAKYGIDMKFIDVDAITALKHHYRQCLTGDTNDGIIGLKGIGPKKADKLLDSCETHADCWAVVLDEYTKAGRGDLDAITNMRLVSMHQLTIEWEVKLWRPL